MNYFLKKTKDLQKFFPVFLFLCLLTLVLNENTFKTSDEIRYLNFSQNLIDGFYAEKDLKPGFLWNGPGYPLVLIPFKYFNSGLIFPKILNSFFLFLGIVFIYKSSLFYLNKKFSFFISLIAGLSHPQFIISISSVLSESLSFFCLSIALYFFIKYSIHKIKFNLIISSFFLSYLILTKVFFAYVLVVCFVFSILFFHYSKNKSNSTNLKISILSLLFISPYLMYTYSITGKFFFMADSGGSSLYSMSSPFENEHGDWFSPDINDHMPDFKNINNFDYGNVSKDQFFNNHKFFLDSISNFNGIKRDQALKIKAVNNILNNKVKYFRNISDNLSRMFFRFPYSYSEKNTYIQLVNFILGFVVIVSFIISIFLFKIKKTPNSLKSILFFILIYLLGASLLSANGRTLFQIYPLIIFFIGVALLNYNMVLKYNIDD